MGLYDLDFHAWTQAQADAIRRRSANEIDWDNLLEEMESLGRSVRSELRSRLTILILHLLKWNIQIRFRSRSWSDTIDIQREELRELLAENPSLSSCLDDVFQRAYALGRKRAAAETGLAMQRFPKTPPFDVSRALDERWLPEAEEDEG